MTSRKYSINIYFYKANQKKATWLDKLIAFWTKSNYSHCELNFYSNFSISAVGSENLTRKARINFNEEEWDKIKISCTKEEKERALEFMESQLGKKYDYIAIFFNFFLPLRKENPKKWFCSEICARALMEINYINFGYKPHRITPGRLYRLVKKYDILNNGKK